MKMNILKYSLIGLGSILIPFGSWALRENPEATQTVMLPLILFIWVGAIYLVAFVSEMNKRIKNLESRFNVAGKNPNQKA